MVATLIPQAIIDRLLQIHVYFWWPFCWIKSSVSQSGKISVVVETQALQAIMAAGRPLGIVNFGQATMNGMRLEHGFKIWGRELTLDTNPFECGLGALVDLKVRSGVRVPGTEDWYFGNSARCCGSRAWNFVSEWKKSCETGLWFRFLDRYRETNPEANECGEVGTLWLRRGYEETVVDSLPMESTCCTKTL